MLARVIFTVTFFQSWGLCGRMHLTAILCLVFQIEEKKQSEEKSSSFSTRSTARAISAFYANGDDIGCNYPSVFAELEDIEGCEVTVANCVTSASSLSNAAIRRRS
jgi:hypothetical protein